MIYDPIDCQALVELANDYLEDGLAAASRTDFELHLATCKGCIAYLEQLRLTSDLVSMLPRSRPDEGTLDQLMDEFRRRGPGSGDPQE